VAQLIAQTLGVLVGSLLLHRIAVRAGLRVELPHAASLAAIVLLGTQSVGYLRDGWHNLDVQRESAAEVTPEAGRRACASVGVDLGFLEFVKQRVPERARFYMHAPPLVNSGEFCVRMLLLPRLQVGSRTEARYFVFWDDLPEPLLADVRRRGAVVSKYGPRFAVARVP
jgi:hypothetical protein